MDVGERMKQLRKELKLSADEVAERVGVNRSTIFRYEKGDIENLPIDKLTPLSHALQTTPAYLMGWEDKPTYANKAHKIMLEMTETGQYNVYMYSLYEREKDKKRKDFEITSKNDSLNNEDNVRYLDNCLGAVSAGTGEMLQEEGKISVRVEETPPPHDYTLIVNGSSMEPMFQDGEVIFVEKSVSARIGQIVIAIINGESYVKKLGKDRLISLNPEYEDIPFVEGDRAEIKGIVVL